MSSIFGSPKQKLPAQEAEPEPVETVTEDATEAGRRRRKRLLAGGAQATRISGIRSAVAAALAKRLGEGPHG